MHIKQIPTHRLRRILAATKLAANPRSPALDLLVAELARRRKPRPLLLKRKGER